jgi:adenosyl cobinamide kinase/adenosyl cobinamide phosphate guanylyltransferase
MRVLVEGSGGASGWPEPGCRCASCLHQVMDGSLRKQSIIVVDETVRLGVGSGGGAYGGGAYGGGAYGGGAHGGGADGGGADWGGAGRGGAHGGGAGIGDAGDEEIPEGYLVRPLADARDPGRAGGWEVTAPDGGRLLFPAGPGAVPVPGRDAEPYDIAFLDLLGEPAQLGLLRARGLVTADTTTMVAFADHRVPSEPELWRRCGFWRAAVPGDGDTVTTDRSDKKDLAGTTRWRPWRVLVLGGARSGKSERAELRLAGEPDVTYVAAGPGGGGAGGGGPAGLRDPAGLGDAADPEWAARVAAHRARRPGWWRTAETTDLAGVLTSAQGANGALLIDGIGTWLAAVLDECGGWDGSAEPAARVAARIAGLVAAWRQTQAYVVAVSDEAGLGVVPATPAGRLFRDELGRLNQLLAAESEETELVVAGRIFPLA